MTIEHGISPEICFALTTTFGVLASQSADAELGFRLAQFGAALADKQPQFGLSGRALLAFGLIVIPWVRPIRSGLPFVQRGLAFCLAVGDLGFAAYVHRGLLSVDLFCGNQLPDVCMRAEQSLAFAQASGLWLTVQTISVQRRLALGLIGRDEERRFEVSNTVEPHPSKGTQPLIAFLSYAAQIQLDVLAGRHSDALLLAKLADEISRHFRNYSEFTEYRFYTGLAHAAAYHVSLPEDREKHIDGLREQHRKFTNWSARVPENFAARKALLAAEIARIEGRGLEAASLFEDSIQLAHDAEFVQIEAIASEHAARFYEARGIRTIVLAYLTRACDCYLRWGAEGKVRQLEGMYPQLQEKAGFGATNTIGASVEHLDLSTVLKVSEAASGEIVRDKLIDTLLRTAIEHAGAERCVLLLPQGAELRIQAEATTADGSIQIDLRDTPLSGAEIPESLILYAARTQESIILDNASQQGAFTGDQYIRRKHARSVLTLPLVKQGKRVALLYLENNLSPHVFTPARMPILKFLASEAATSLDNPRLYRELQERESRIRRLVDSNIVGVFIFGAGYEIIDANDSFLKTVGYDREDINTGRLRRAGLTPPEWQDRTAIAHEEMKRTGAIQPLEKEFFRKDGSRVPIMIGAATFDDKPDQGVAFVLDLSERKRAEAEARESEARYREAQIELEHANRVAVLGQLTASIAHEVNQPNTAVVASAQAALRWLDRRPSDVEKVRLALARIEQNAMRASDVIGRIRNLIKKSPPRKDCLAIKPVIHEVIELTHAETTKNGVLVRTEFAEHLPDVVGDRVELQQVAVNLVLNATEAMSAMMEGKRELLIRTTKAKDDTVLIAVMDSGPGLPTASPERLFEPFYATKTGGLGIGLSICRSIIEAHGGRLWASANEPRGAVFQFTLPSSGTSIN